MSVLGGLFILNEYIFGLKDFSRLVFLPLVELRIKDLGSLLISPLEAFSFKEN